MKAQRKIARPKPQTLADYGFPPDAAGELLPPPEGERAHYARDKWLPGPWTEEPFDKIVWVDPTTQLDCMMVRGPMGSWCGYVGVSKAHPWHGVDYNGCVNKHEPKTEEQRMNEALQWLADARAKFEREPTDANESALNLAMLTAKPWTDPEMKDSFMRKMKSWACLTADDNRCETPDGIIRVHGGLTYSRGCQGNICHPHKEGRPDDIWWFGFDTAHYMDMIPGKLSLSKEMAERSTKLREAYNEAYDAWKADPMGNPKPAPPPDDRGLWTEHLTYDPVTGADMRYGTREAYRDIGYVKLEVVRMAEQLRTIQNGVN